MFSIAQEGDSGFLRVNVNSGLNQFPIEDAVVDISSQLEPDRIIEELKTDRSGQTEQITLPAPSVDLSLEPQELQPYSEYRITVSAPGYEPVTVEGSEILAGVLSTQPVRLQPVEPGGEPIDISIPDHTLYGEYPPKIPEAEIKPVNESGEIVLSRVVVPEYVIVHDGVPGDTTAPDYYVPYRDYIKNVASSEIYATWPEEALVANILAIQSFTMNRVYTEWYRNKGYNFTITSSTAYDQKFIYRRNIFQTISRVVDDIFDNYLSLPDVRQPIFTQYCDGNRVSCPGWMTQWGSCSLAERGYSAIEIIRHFYGSDMYINSAEEVAGLPYSWPGYNLDIGSYGQPVRTVQEQLNSIGSVYTAIPPVVVDGIYGESTQEAVRRFQQIFGLTPDGIVGRSTWYKLSQLYVALEGLAEF
ncbi:MAG: peptidoglycan-binding protein [Lachnospiraceae bacterium]|nr:peptidoglycan-binding protein [Lachnospiraceae bacterium]MDY4969058.1 peptidoglycan-binding protein [Lachnospiraceae bacterium]